MQLKSDAAIFAEVLDAVRNQEWMGNRKWWPNYLFHFTDIKNALKILEMERLLSRELLAEHGGMKNENASPEVIDHTEDTWKKFVRFYFRPRTPTQYNNEGFRPKSNRSLGAHCPLPIFFVFKSLPLLTMNESQFSYGSLAAHDAVSYTSGDKFREMPFEYIYHDGSYNTQSQYFIKHHKHAEVIIPDQCNLNHLYRIVCRSHAEKETFLSEMGSSLSRKWEKAIVVDTSGKFFYSNWTYVDKALLTNQKIIFQLNKGNKVTGHFTYRVEILEFATGTLYKSINSNYSPRDQLTFALGNLNHPHHYSVKFYLDDDLAYSNTYYQIDEPPF